jgi:predicted O-methyltransferase YrrM
MDPTATHLPILNRLLAERKIKDVLEFGCGLFSTKCFVDHGCNVTSIEMQHEEWASKVKAELPSVNLILSLGPFEWEEIDLKPRYDLIFVDGHRDSRPECMEWAKDKTDLIVAHDTEHPYYGWDRADMSGFSVVTYKDFPTWTTVWERIK